MGSHRSLAVTAGIRRFLVRAKEEKTQTMIRSFLKHGGQTEREGTDFQGIFADVIAGVITTRSRAMYQSVDPYNGEVLQKFENLSDENMWSALEVAIRYFMTTGLELAIRNAARF
jgi:hypothetical protein